MAIPFPDQPTPTTARVYREELIRQTMDYKKVYFIGIGGIGMSGLAQLLVQQGKQVSGSDREESPTTEMLARKGISVTIGQTADNVALDTDLVIYSDAVYADNPERMRAADMGIPQYSYFEALGEVSRSMRTIAVAGTHGKTTTTGMLAKMLSDAAVEPTAIIGSIVRDFESNYLPGRPDLFVVEACEYRDHILKLSPEILVITNVELDHTDYFPDLAALQETFRIAAEKVPSFAQASEGGPAQGGVIVTNPSDPNIAPILQNVTAKVIDYTQVHTPTLQLIGEFNRENAQAAKAAALAAFPDLDERTIDESLSSYRGAWRRFEYRGKTPSGALVYDDYAHHPTAIMKTIEAARARFPGKKIVVAFHPHLYSRTKSLIHEFAAALATADFAIVAPIYAAREALDPTVSNHILAKLINSTMRQGYKSDLCLGTSLTCAPAIAIDSFDEIRDRLLQEGEDALIITMGAGDIYKVAQQIAD
ncbi:UDP-N-acetylmuramate--L-alanine ligase [Candidatus Kaiserbacteria bacterium]|nr:UDP-N-acetylmuramate--L-alanine ligase [Candidatus Kaiserbacteria bacterium]